MRTTLILDDDVAAKLKEELPETYIVLVRADQVVATRWTLRSIVPISRSRASGRMAPAPLCLVKFS